MNDNRLSSLVPTLPPPSAGIRVVLFGIECEATRIVLDALCASGVEMLVLCLPGPPGSTILRAPIGARSRGLPLAVAPANPPTSETARTLGIEVWRVGDLRAPEVAAAIDGLGAELLIVACFSRLIPSALYRHLQFGGINIHPSLLPEKRGPDPLFWTFKQGDQVSGSTVHRLTSRFDAGEILAQAPMEVPEGISEAELDALLARRGAELTREVMSAMHLGKASGRQQDDAVATWAPHPTSDDYSLDLSGTARAAFNFVRGVAGRGHPLLATADGRVVAVDDAVAWADSTQDLPRAAAGEIVIRFARGVLLARTVSRDGAQAGRFPARLRPGADVQ